MISGWPITKLIGTQEVFDWSHWGAFLFGLVFVWACVYMLQELDDQPKDEFEEYTLAIANIETTATQLSGLVGFLKQEREKILESQATLTRLRDEQTELEPVILAKRETVNAVLSAYSRTTASRVWKERLLGFIIGFFASLVARMVLSYLRG